MKKIVSLILALTLCLGIVFTLASCKKEKDHYVIGVIQLAPHEALDAATQGFMDTLKAKLEAKGKTVEFKYENAQGDSNTCNTIVNSFIAAGVDLIMANATSALAAAYNATTTIPILGTSITEYGVALNIENFNGTVGGNVSGTSDLAPLDQQADMMVDTLGLKAGDVVGLLYCSSEDNSVYQVKKVKEQLGTYGIVCNEYTFADSTTIQTTVAKASGECTAIYVPTDNVAAANAEIIKNACDIPIFAGEEGICKGCGYATLSISYYSLGQVTGEMAAEILLGGAKIEDMAIRYDSAPVKKYNKAACVALGIDTSVLESKGYVMIPGTEN